MLWLLVIYVTLVYAPIAAWLVELFPSRIRYSGLSLPYHIGNGWFGGFLPATVFAIVAATGNIYSGLWYPVGIARHEPGHRLPVPAGNQGRRHHQDLSDRPAAAAADIDQQPAADRSAAGFVFTRPAPDELQHDLAPMRARAMLDQVDRLPGSQREFALQHRNLQRSRRQHGLDMRRHVVGAFGVVASIRRLRARAGRAPSSDRRAPTDRRFPGSSATPRYGG